MEKNAFDILCTDLFKRRTALVLGPEFVVSDSEKGDIVDQQKAFLQANNLETFQYLKPDGFFYKTGNTDNKTSEKRNLALKLAEFYKQQPLHENYKWLAELPFSFILSLSPDNQIEKAFRKINRPYELIYYQKGDFFRRNPQTRFFSKIKEEYTPVHDQTVILNLMGFHEEESSMVITYDDFFESLGPLLSGVNLTVKISALLEGVNSFLFFGFRYDKWYLNFIFYLIKQLQGKADMFKKAIVYMTKEQSEALDFYTKAFNFEFYNEEKTSRFIFDLNDQAKTEGNLYTGAPVGTDPLQGESGIKRLLYIASNPDVTSPIGADEEHDRIVAVVNNKQYGNSLELVNDVKRASTVKDLVDYIDLYRPHLVVVSAHGNENNELLFKDESKGVTRLSEQGLIKIFEYLTKNSRNRLEGVIFSCCDSDQLAEKAKQYVTYTVGIQGAWPIQAAAEFIEGFLKKFCETKNPVEAFNKGNLSVDLFRKQVQVEKLWKNLAFEAKLFT